MTPSVDLSRFAATEDAFAARFTRDDLPGLLRKRLEVPQGAIALVRPEAGDAVVLRGAAETNDAARGLLVKERLRLELDVDAGRSQDDLAFRARLGLELRARPAPIDLEQLERTLLATRAEAARADVLAFFEPYVREAVRFFVGSRRADDLATRDQRAELERCLTDELKRPLFEAGLDLRDVLHPTFASDDLDARRRAAADAAGKAQALSHERDLLSLRKQLDKEALLADLEVREEANQALKEKRLARYEALRARMGDDDRKALVMMLDDDAQRAKLIQELIEQDMTPEQRSGLKVSEMEAKVEARLVELQQRLSQLTGGGLEARKGDPVTRRLLCVIEKRVLAFDPKTNLNPEVPKEVYDAEGGSLGYLRSARADRIGADEYVFAGAQLGVYRFRWGSPGGVGGAASAPPSGDRFEYRFARDPEGKGGVNAVAYFDGRVFATHSEVGLTEWPFAGGTGRTLCGEATTGASATRGATVANGRLFFSSGSDVLALDLATGSDRPVRYKGSDDSITTFVVADGEVVAGNRSGKIYRWALDDPGSPEAFHVLKKNPIYMLRHAQVAGQPFFVIGSKDLTVTLAEPRRDVFREYQAREEVRWVDAAGDYVFGVARSGFKVFIWDALRQAEPKLTVRVADKVQDLFVVKGLPGPAGTG